MINKHTLITLAPFVATLKYPRYCFMRNNPPFDGIKFGYSPKKYFHTSNTTLATSEGVDSLSKIENYSKKINFGEIVFSPAEFSHFHSFVQKFDKLDISYRYSLVFRICYGNDSTFKMLGNQYHLVIPNEPKKLKCLRDLYNLMKTRLAVSKAANYKYNGQDVISIQILVYKVTYSDAFVEQPKELYKKFNKDNVNKNIINTPLKALNLVDYKVLPLTMYFTKYGQQLYDSYLYVIEFQVCPIYIKKQQMKKQSEPYCEIWIKDIIIYNKILTFY